MSPDLETLQVSKDSNMKLHNSPLNNTKEGIKVINTPYAKCENMMKEARL